MALTERIQALFQRSPMGALSVFTFLTMVFLLGLGLVAMVVIGASGWGLESVLTQTDLSVLGGAWLREFGGSVGVLVLVAPIGFLHGILFGILGICLAKDPINRPESGTRLSIWGCLSNAFAFVAYLALGIAMGISH